MSTSNLCAHIDTFALPSKYLETIQNMISHKDRHSTLMNIHVHLPPIPRYDLIYTAIRK